MEEIYLSELECPYCDRNSYCEHCSIQVDENRKCQTVVMCDECGGEFIVETKLDVRVKEKL